MNIVLYLRTSKDCEKYYSLIQTYCSLLSPKRYSKIKSINNISDRFLRAASEIIVRWIYLNCFNINNSKIDFRFNRFGKPYYNKCNNLFFNVSYTTNAVVVAFSAHQIGVDIEKVKSCNDSISHRFFQASECNYIYSTDTKKDFNFYDVWTKKEAYAKYTGKGISIGFKSFDVLSDIHKNHYYTISKYNYLINVYSKNVNEKCVFIELTFSSLINMANQLKNSL